MTQIPLALGRRRDGSLEYGMPIWFRILSVGILAVIAAASIAGGSPGALGVVCMALLLLGAAYEERWIVDRTSKTLVHVAGFLPFTRRTGVPFDAVVRVRVDAVASSALPGSESERRIVDETLGAATSADAIATRLGKRGQRRGKVLVNLLIETKDGDVLLVDLVPASRLQKMRDLAELFAGEIGVPAV